MTGNEWSSLFPFHFGQRAEHRASLELLRSGDAGREQVEGFIHDRFNHAHHADIRHFLPELLALRDAEGRLLAVAGMRLAEQGPLFLEQYLDEPLEHPVSRLAGRAVERSELVEVGNLSSIGAGSARLVIIAATWLLAARGLEWVAFTGAASLLNSFHRLGLEPLVLARAEAQRLDNEHDDWGSYYAQQPHVFAGNIRHGRDLLQRSGVFAGLGFPFLNETDHAA
ncbi:Thermostable hemolysin [compost metagenome]